MSATPTTRTQEIRELRALGLTLDAIGVRYGISRQRVWQILNAEKRTARALPDPLNLRSGKP